MKGLAVGFLALLTIAAWLVPTPREAPNPGVSRSSPQAVADLGPSSGTAGSVLLLAPAKSAERSTGVDATTPTGPQPSALLTARAHSHGVVDPRRAAVDRPSPSAKPRSAPKAVQRVSVARSGVQYAVHATWYCDPPRSRCTRGYPASGMYAAISPDLRTWTGRLVRVCTPSACVTVRVVDCDCQAEHSIDLYAAAFRQLAPTSAGVLTVTLEIVG